MSQVTDDNRFAETINEIEKGDEPKNMCTVLDKVENKGREEGRKEGQKEITQLMAYLASKGQYDDIVKANEDEDFLYKLLADQKEGRLF